MGERTIGLLSGFIISLCGLYLAFESANPFLAMDVPCLTLGIKANPFEHRGANRLLGSVAKVEASSAKPQVITLVVKPVPVCMVNVVQLIGYPDNDSVGIDRLPLVFAVLRSTCVHQSTSCWSSIPLPLRHEFIVLVVDEHNKIGELTCESDLSHGSSLPHRMTEIKHGFL